MAEKVYLYDILSRIADEAILLQLPDGSFSGGHNGKHNDKETPVRNTSHWLVTLLKVYTYTKDEKYKIAANKALDYLLSNAARPMGASFWHRTNPNKDTCNTTVGQSFTIEALTYAYEVLGSNQAKDIAEEVFLMHPFDESTGLWHSLSADGTYLPIGFTLNHQLWFAATGALLWEAGRNEEIHRIVGVCIDNLNKNISIHKLFYRGLIHHFIIRAEIYGKLKDMNFLKKLRISLRLRKKSMRIIATCYQVFNLGALSILKDMYPEKSFWNSKKFKLILKFMNSKTFERAKDDFGLYKPNTLYKYENLPVREAFALLSFDKSENKMKNIEDLLSRHVEQEYNPETHMLNKYAQDKNTQAARIYEVTRLPNLCLTLRNKDIIDYFNS